METIKGKKSTDSETVAAWLEKLDHPLKAELLAVRAIILRADPKLCERIKWAAPSYYYKHDLVTFNPRNKSRVHLVFHHVAVTHIHSPLLQGDYKDRRMLYLNDMQEVTAHENVLTRILQELVTQMDHL